MTMHRLRRTGGALLATALLTGAAVVATGTPASAADPAYGFDVSWPQCPRGTGTIPGRQGLGLPMPPADSEFMIIGLTNGPAFTPNPCLASQVAYARDHGQWTAGYAISSFPTAAQLQQHGGSGTRLQQLQATGRAQAAFNVANMRAAGLRTSILWVDVEPVSSAPWTADPVENNAVIDGVLEGYAAAGLRTGWYSYASAWSAITAGRRSALPTWVPAGRSDRAGALRKCAEPSFSGGPVVFGQWTDTVYDFNVTCPGRVSSAYLIPPDASRDPIGSLDELQLAPGGVAARGWTLDPDAVDPIAVHLYANGTGHPRVADVSRPDVAAAFGKGDRHGFDTVVPTGSGRQDVCAYGINVLAGWGNTRVGCRSFTVPSTAFGAFDAVTRVPGGVRVRGWALDPSTGGALPVHAYVGARGSALTADALRPDVGRAYPRFGDRHGLDAVVPATGSGPQRVCLYAIGRTANPTLGCRDVTVTHEPYGALDEAVRTATGVRVRGWAADPDTTAPLRVEVLANGVLVDSLVADGSRPDVAAAFPLHGSARGYDGSVGLPAGTSSVCARAVDTDGGAPTVLGCRTV